MHGAIVGVIVALVANCSSPGKVADKATENGGAQRVTLAQIFVSKNVKRNLEHIRAAFAQAKKDHAAWIAFPEGALSGYHDGFDQREVAEGFEEVRQLCKDTGLSALMGTCWKEGGQTFNEVRIVDSKGALAGRYAKRCLTYGDAKQFAPGAFPLVHEVNGMRWGTLICNDLWVTPGYSDGPNPHLSLKAAREGAQVIFQCVNSGTDQRFRAYHESHLSLWSAEAKCPIIVVNAAHHTAVNCASGVVSGFEYEVALPRGGEVIRTVEFTPATGLSPRK